MGTRGANHYFPAIPPQPGEEAICGYILASEAEPANPFTLQTYCKVCLKAVLNDHEATLFAQADI